MKVFLVSLALLCTLSPSAFCQDYKTSANLANGYKSVSQTIPASSRLESPKLVYGIINPSGKLVLPVAYRLISQTAEKNIVEIKDSNSNVGLFSTLSGKIIADPEYYDIKSFSEGLAVVLKKAPGTGFLWGALNTKGEIVIPLDHEYLGLCKDGLINFKKDGKFGFLDKRNNIIIPAVYDNMSSFSEGLAAVKSKEGKFGYIDKKNNWVIEPKYEGAAEFYQGYAKVAEVVGYRLSRARSGSTRTVEGEYMLINKKGKELFDSTYHNISYRQEGGLFVVELNKKKGVLDSTGKQLLPVEYQEVYVDKEGNITYKKSSSGTSGMVNRKGVEILKPQYDYISSATNGRFYSKQKGKFAVWNINGKILVPEDSATGIFLGKTKIVLYYDYKVRIFDGNGKPVKTIADYRLKSYGHKLNKNEDSITLNVDQTAFLVNLSGNSKKTLEVKEVGDFNEEGIFIGKNNSYHFYDHTGKKMNTEGFYAAVNFSEGVCALQKSISSTPYLADKQFKKIRALTVVFNGPFSEGLGLGTMSNFGKLYYLDKTGSEVFNVFAKEGGACTEGFILIKNNTGRFNHVNKKGRAVGAKTWEEAGNFSEGLALVKDKGKWGFIDTAGNIAIELKYDIASAFSKGVAVVKSGTDYFLINKKGEPINSNKYEAAGNPGNGTFPLQKNGKVGIVNSQGNTVIDFKYKNIIYISEDRTWGLMDSTWGLIDSKGKELTPFKYSGASNFNNGFAQVKLNGKTGLVNSSGKLVLPAIYKSVGKVYKNSVICLKPEELVTVALK